MIDGLSIIICCYNGANRLPTTLAHLVAQERPSTPWEVLLVDNCSSDGSAVVAQSCWKNGPVPLRIIKESRPGVRFARERGLNEAKYKFVGFVDDDNWVAGDWVRTAHEIISSESSLGAVGSIRVPVCEVSPPTWFSNFQSIYAVLTETELEQIRGPIEYLPTAGLCLRGAAWENLIQNGFRVQLTGSIGKSPQGGEDMEITRALRLSGWTLRIDKRLRLQHYIPGYRLEWNYLRKLQRNYSASDVLLDAYTVHSLSLQPGVHRWLSEQWWFQLQNALRGILRRPGALTAAILGKGEGRDDILEIERHFGRLLGLLHLKRRYGESPIRDTKCNLAASRAALFVISLQKLKSNGRRFIICLVEASGRRGWMGEFSRKPRETGTRNFPLRSRYQLIGGFISPLR